MEPLVREIEAKGVITKTDIPVCDFAVNPYVGCTHACKYCYASFMKRFTGHAEEWGTFLDVKRWPPIKRPERYAGKELFFGTVTDPYNPQEETFGRTRALLGELRGSGARITIQTKSDLVLRDLDLLAEFPDALVGFSINTLDEDFREQMDRAVPIERRLAAMERLHEAGVRTTCFISPIFPGVTDCEAIIERVRGICQLVWLENLNLRGDYKARILGWVHERRPELDGLYEAIYRRRDRSYWEGLDAGLRTFAETQGLPYVRDDDSMRRSFDAPPVLVNFFFHEQVKKSAKAKRG